MSDRRPFPPEDYAYPDARNKRIKELEAALLESNNTAATIRAQLCDECERVLAVKVKAGPRPGGELARGETR